MQKVKRADRSRLDQLLVERGLAETRSKAQALILAGQVKVAGLVSPKAGSPVEPDQIIEILENLRFVSRGGEKLEGALNHFQLTVKDRVCLDVGASTGGFTDCLLQRGARQVAAVDVGHGQLHWKMRQDTRVINWEKKHALQLTKEDLAPYQPDFFVVDVSFISLEKVLPHLAGLMQNGTMCLAMVKPQFEAGPKNAPKGVVRDPEVRERVIVRLVNLLPSWGFDYKGGVDSSLKGPKGNLEHFLYFVKHGAEQK